MTSRSWMAALTTHRQSAPVWRLTFTLLLIAVFALQCQFTQTHVHRRGASPASAFASAALKDSALKSNAGAPARQRSPAGENDPAHCTLCQAVAVAGSFAPAIASILLLPAESNATFLLEGITPALSFPRDHHWRGRAPPAP